MVKFAMPNSKKQAEGSASSQKLKIHITSSSFDEQKRAEAARVAAQKQVESLSKNEGCWSGALRIIDTLLHRN